MKSSVLISQLGCWPLAKSTLILAVFLGGCASSGPAKQADAPIVVTPDISSVRRAPEANQDKAVQWGGTVVSLENRADATWIEVIGRPLRDGGQPDLLGASDGRFIAVVSGFLDPEDYTTGRSVTVTGAINGAETRKIGEADYNYPIVAVSDHQLWAQGSERYVVAKNKPVYYGGYGYGYHPYPFFGSLRFGFGHGFGRIGFSSSRFFYGGSRFGGFRGHGRFRGRGFSGRGFSRSRGFSRGGRSFSRGRGFSRGRSIGTRSRGFSRSRGISSRGFRRGGRRA